MVNRLEKRYTEDGIPIYIMDYPSQPLKEPSKEMKERFARVSNMFREMKDKYNIKMIVNGKEW